MENEMSELLRDLATQLGTTTEYLWEVLIKQAYVHSIMLWLPITFFIITLPTMFFLRRMYKKQDEEENWSRWMDFKIGFGISIGVNIILFFVCIGCIANSIAINYNPEFWALDEILRRI